MLISKLSRYQLSNIKKVSIVIPVLNEDKNKIIRFDTKTYNRKQFVKPLETILAKPHIYQIEHWFEHENESKAYIYRRQQHIYRFNDDILVYLALKYNLKLEVVGLNLKILRQLENI